MLDRPARWRNRRLGFCREEIENGSGLRLLLFEAGARGLGIRRRLSPDVVRFTPKAGDKKMTLLIPSELRAAHACVQEEDCGPVKGKLRTEAGAETNLSPSSRT